jgi:hypothetical protein
MTDVKQRPKKDMPVSPGRPKGVPNKMTTEVKQMILDALEGAGGVDYLIEKAKSHPQAFLALVGKVLPLQVNGAGENGEHLVNASITVSFVAPDASQG